MLFFEVLYMPPIWRGDPRKTVVEDDRLLKPLHLTRGYCTRHAGSLFHHFTVNTPTHYNGSDTLAPCSGAGDEMGLYVFLLS